MGYYSRIFFALIIFAATFSARAEVLVLVHGYMGSAASWEESRWSYPPQKENE